MILINLSIVPTAMGRRKFRLGRHPKNYERKRQAAKINHMGRPSRRRRRQVDTPDITAESPTPIQPTTIETLRHSLKLPGPQWSEQTSEDTSTIQICKIQSFSTSSSSSSSSTSTPFQLPVVTHSVTVYEDRTWIAFVHGHQIDHKKSSLLSSIPNVLDEKSLENLLLKINQCTVCPGHPDDRFIQMASSKHGKLMSKDGKKVVGFIDKYAPVCLNGDTYDCTVRNSECEIIVNGGKCEKCVSYRDTLRKAYHRWQKKKQRSPGRHTSTTSKTNFRYLNTPEKQERYKKLKHRSRTVERRLSDVIAKQMQDKGVILEPEIHNDIERIMEEKTGEIRENYPEDSFRRLFWEQQLNALKTKEKRQLRWHPAIIKWCLHLKFKSSGAYHVLRSTGVLTLPSERTLRDYTHWVKGGVGFKSDVNEQLIKEANVQEEKDKYIVLVFDEMKIREDLVFNKHTSQLVGFIDLGDVNNVLTELERQCTNPDSLEDVVATHMLTFMVRGIFSNLEFPYAQFPTNGATADVLFPIVWDGVKNLEESGFKVMVITCDGASSNRKFVTRHQTPTAMTTGRYFLCLMYHTLSKRPVTVGRIHLRIAVQGLSG